MNKKVLYLLVAYLLLLFWGMASCTNCDDGGPNFTRFKTTEVSSEFVQVSQRGQEEGGLNISAVVHDTVSFSLLGIQLNHEIKYYAGIKRPFLEMISSAYACDPEDPISDELLESILITSTTPFSTEYPAGSDLSALFDVYVDGGYRWNERQDLNDYLSTMPSGPYSLLLVLKEQPAETQAFSFDIEYHQDGVDFDLFEFSTEAVVIKKV